MTTPRPYAGMYEYNISYIPTSYDTFDYVDQVGFNNVDFRDNESLPVNQTRWAHKPTIEILGIANLAYSFLTLAPFYCSVFLNNQTHYTHDHIHGYIDIRSTS